MEQYLCKQIVSRYQRSVNVEQQLRAYLGLSADDALSISHCTITQWAQVSCDPQCVVAFNGDYTYPQRGSLLIDSFAATIIKADYKCLFKKRFYRRNPFSDFRRCVKTEILPNVSPDLTHRVQLEYCGKKEHVLCDNGCEAIYQVWCAYHDPAKQRVEKHDNVRIDYCRLIRDGMVPIDVYLLSKIILQRLPNVEPNELQEESDDAPNFLLLLNNIQMPLNMQKTSENMFEHAFNPKLNVIRIDSAFSRVYDDQDYAATFYCERDTK